MVVKAATIHCADFSNSYKETQLDFEITSSFLPCLFKPVVLVRSRVA